MPTRRWKWNLAAGLLLTAGSTATAQDGQRLPILMPMQREASVSLTKDDMPPAKDKIEVLPAPRSPTVNGHPGMVAPAAPVAGCGDGWGGRGLLARWQRCKADLQKSFLGDPREWESAPLGYFLYQHGRTMVANGDAARMVFYHYDFIECSDQLNLRGKDKLAKIAGMLPKNFFPIVIERMPEHVMLAEARRQTVLNELALGAFPIPPERVVVGMPIANGLKGSEALLIYTNLLSNTQTGGRVFGGSGGGFDTSGLSGGLQPSGVGSGNVSGAGTTGGSRR